MNKVAEDYYVLEDRVYMENSLGHQPLKKSVCMLQQLYNTSRRYKEEHI